ncbi:nucleotidyl transferase AbiEii/AbiGii toxin family protein [Sorangium sp. So ce281]|uniref:nucleotidyl transferase AbiEii/AbiGii toxin family protein n=1 Tax=unclassified Sorangium TaxID=2621164 RepID=UPI003F5EF8D0
MTEVLSSAQRTALEVLARAVEPSTYLAGGVAVALRLQHRQSRDLDLFTAESDPAALVSALVDPTIRVLTRAEGTLYLEVGGVPASILRYCYPLLGPPECLSGIPLPVASLDDLECMKLSAIAGRGARRDFWDLHALLTSRGRSVGQALDAYARKYATEDVGHVVRSLAYFADAEAEPMPAGMTEERWTQIRSDLVAWVRAT